MQDSVKNTGTVLIQLLDADGNIIEELNEDNLVVDSGLTWIAALLTSSPARMSHMAMGSNGAASSPGLVGLNNEIARVALEAATTAGKTTTYTANFPAGVGTGTLAELGIFNAAGGGTMLNRVVFAAQTKESTTSVRVVWSVTQS